MARKWDKQRTKSSHLVQTVAYLFSAVVVLSMIIGLVGPLVFREPEPPTPTWPPTWTPTLVPPSSATRPTSTPTVPLPTATRLPATAALTVTLTAAPTAEPLTRPVATVAPTPAASPTVMVSATITPMARLVFAVCGDSRDGDAVYAKVLTQVAQDGSAFLVSTGDLVTSGTEGNYLAFRKLMAGFGLPFYPVPGNHDRAVDGSLTDFTRYSGAPGPRYSFDAGPVHLTLANSSSGHLGPQELAWIDQDLTGTHQPVKIVVLHHPPFDPDGTDHILQSGNEGLMSLMEKHQVAYVFAGHIHAYSQAERNGTVYVVTGGAGAPLYTTGHPNAFYHYLQVTVEGTRVSTKVVRLD